MNRIVKNRLWPRLAVAALSPLAVSAQKPRPLIIGVLSYQSGEADAADSVSRAAERGLLLGIEEADQTARLFGRRVVEKRVVIKRRDDALRAARIMARTTNMSALLVTNPELMPAADAMLGGKHVPGYAVVVLRTLPSEERGSCSAFSFALYPPADALRRVTRPAGSAVALWTGSLQRFGALELNDRYRARWKSGMTGAAWASWAAVKIIAEASLRTSSVEPFTLLAYLKKSEFDGHKGWPLTFRKADHLLRQPIYIVSESDSKLLQELPAGARAETESAASVLDALLPVGPIACR